jgi:hypothetical protein
MSEAIARQIKPFFCTRTVNYDLYRPKSDRYPGVARIPLVHAKCPPSVIHNII